ncbi:MAG: DUF2073 domain-containing protein [Candidatus Aenigmatarchaeota archaeon]|nr:MAG: DUF2073 domain-containing protein [Candidatus Aenigmarchaeota archaeon]
MRKSAKGINIEFLSRERLARKSFNEKLKMIFDKVKNRTIVVLEEALTADEKKLLIERSVREAKAGFPGIEFVGFDARAGPFDAITRLFGWERREGLVVVGSSDVIEKVREEKDAISLLAKLR